jgi:hypothetical protein
MSNELTSIKSVAATFAVFTGLMLLGIVYPRNDFVLIVGRPGTNEAGMMDLVARAGGTFVSGGNLSWLAVAHAENSEFTTRLLKAGALLVLDHSLAAGCLERK